MRLTLDALSVLDAIDRKGSFAAAADELHRVPSAITYTVQKLEQDLGLQLFDRAKHRAVLTAAGRELLREGRHMLRAAAELEARVKRVATGWEAELRIAYDDIIPAEALLPLAGDFYREQHGTRLRLAAEVFGGVWEALVSGRADLVIARPAQLPLQVRHVLQGRREVPQRDSWKLLDLHAWLSTRLAANPPSSGRGAARSGATGGGVAQSTFTPPQPGFTRGWLRR